jgi:hypothetical protein
MVGSPAQRYKLASRSFHRSLGDRYGSGSSSPPSTVNSPNRRPLRCSSPRRSTVHTLWPSACAHDRLSQWIGRGPRGRSRLCPPTLLQVAQHANTSCGPPGARPHNTRVSRRLAPRLRLTRPDAARRPRSTAAPMPLRTPPPRRPPRLLRRAGPQAHRDRPVSHIKGTRH